MKLSFSILVFLVLLSVFVPFFLFIYKGLNSASKTKQKAENSIKSNGFIYNLKEVWTNKFIGIAQENNRLTYIQFNKDNNEEFNINLSDIKTCELVKNYNNGRDKVVRLDSLCLNIAFRTKDMEAVTLPFFNTDDGFTEDYELLRIEKWHTIINNAIAKGLKIAS